MNKVNKMGYEKDMKLIMKIIPKIIQIFLWLFFCYNFRIILFCPLTLIVCFYETNTK